MQGIRSTQGNVSDTEAELYFLIARYLGNGPCQRAAKALIEEVEENELLPKRLDWLGNEHQRTYQDLVRCNPHIAPDHLLKACQRIGPVLDREIRPSVSGVCSLLGAGRQSLLRTKNDLLKTTVSPSGLVARLHGSPLTLPVKLLKQPNTAQLIVNRELCGPVLMQQLLPTKFYKSIQLCCRRLGHLSSVYCLLFDRTGRYIFTGADDLLVKIWNASDGRLLSTLRGHSAEITDMAVNYENTLLAAGSCDKIIRVWCLRTMSPIAILTAHTAMITSLKFCPCPKGVDRYLISTGNDGCIFFWQWNVLSSQFNTQPRRYTERNRPGAQMQCSSFSPGGIFVATGSTDHHVRVYNVYGQIGPERILEQEAHSDRVDSIQFANHSERFVSGSRDGTANIWRYERQSWRKILLRMSTRLPGDNTVDADENKVTRYKVTMVGWDLVDKYVITAVNDFSLKVWNSYTGSLIYVLEGHEDEVFVLETHPTDPRIFLSAGHDGRIILWDLTTGTMIKNYFNVIEGQGHGAVFDCKFSPDGRSFASTDSHGHLSIFGFGSNDKFRKIPDELFFHTDYRPLIRDANHHVLDEQTQQAPHLMPPPFLVNIDGNPYPPEFQRLVPGRGKCTESQLIPHVVNTGGADEVEVFEPLLPPPNNDARQSDLDVMIERLRREQEGRRGSAASGEGASGARNNQGPLSPRPVGARHPSQINSPSHGRVGMRRSGDVEGVRQSHGDWQSRVSPTQGDLLAWSRRVVVRPANPAVLQSSEWKRLALSEMELARYRQEKRRRPLPSSSSNNVDKSARHNRRKGQGHGYKTRSTGEDRTARRRAYESDFENPDLINMSSSNGGSTDDGRAWKSSSDSDSESSEYSDWTQDAGVNLQPPKRTVPTKSSRRKRHAFLEEEEDENNEDKSKSKLTSSSKSKQQDRQKREKRLKPPSEVRPEFKPSKWLTETVPHKVPYYPQMGDEIIYFQQGHKCYVEAIRRSKKYKISERNQPWHKVHLREQELVKVVGIKYEIKPPRLCCLKLSSIDPQTGRITDQSFSIKYHDMPDVIDFLVLRQTYDLAMSRNWKAGDRFRSMIDNAWWVGTIASQEPFESKYPDSMFQCFNVAWDNGEREKMSPWDLEPLDENRMPIDVGGSIEVLPDELKAMLYKPCKNEWPMHGVDNECERILRGLEQIMELSVAEPFIAPVDLNSYPMYAYIVEYPIDLSIIKARVQNRFYRRVTSVQFDVRFIENNTRKFNELNSPIVKQARMVTELCLRFIEDILCTDVRPLYQILASLPMQSDTSDQNSSSESSDSSEEELEKRCTRPSLRKQQKGTNETITSTSWKQHCLELVALIIQCEDSEPFRTPVDLAEYPDYRAIVDNPMDFGTIRDLLASNHYQSPIEFCRDARLIFQNSRNYNINKKSRIYSMTIRLSAMFEDHIRGVISDWNSVVKYEEKIQNKRYVSKRRRPLPRTRAELVPSSRPSARTHLPMSSSQSSSHDGAGPSSSRSLGARLASKKDFESRSRRRRQRRVNSDEENDDDDDDVNKDYNMHNGRSKRKPGARSKNKPRSQLANGHIRRGPRARARTKNKKQKLQESEDESSKENNSENDSDEVEVKKEPGRPRRTITPKKRRVVRRLRSPKAIQRDGKKSAKSASSSNSESSSNSDSDSPNAKTKSSSSSGSRSKSKSPLASQSNSRSSSSSGSSSDSSSSSDSDSDEERRSKSDSEIPKPQKPTKKALETVNEEEEEEDDEEEEVERDEDGDESVEDSESGDVRRSRRTTTRNSTKATRSALHSNENRLRNKRIHSDSDDSNDNSARRSKRIATRKRTVRYREDSDFEYEFNSDDSFRSVKARPRARGSPVARRSRTPGSPHRNSLSISSRGRLRKLTPLAQSFIRS